MNNKPIRVQLSRKKGWKMPENTVKVDRTTKWGNPFVVGVNGTAQRCVDLMRLLAMGYFCLTTENSNAQKKSQLAMLQAKKELRGKNLACWCRADKPCHADVLLEIANQ